MSNPVSSTDDLSLLDSSASPPVLRSPRRLTRSEHTGPAGKSRLKPQPSKRPGDKPLQSANPWQGGVDWGTVVWFVIIHAGALAAPFFFTWKAVALFVGMYWLTGGLGICLGYHRLLTHGSFQTYRPVRWFFAFLGGLAGEGSAVIWVASHRQHHAHSDKEGDPHSRATAGCGATCCGSCPISAASGTTTWDVAMRLTSSKTQ